MYLPDVDIKVQTVIDTYHEYVTESMRTELHLRAIIRELSSQRDEMEALANRCAEDARAWEKRYTELEKELSKPYAVRTVEGTVNENFHAGNAGLVGDQS